MVEGTRTRNARGARRRGELVEAAASLVLERGLAGLSHRAVAARAGLPLASTTYYFDSADDLRDEALTHITESWSARAEAMVDALPSALDHAGAAQAVVGIIGAESPVRHVELIYERYLEAGRHERLRPVIVAWNARTRRLVGQVLLRAGLPSDEDSARLVLAVADGVAVTALAEGVAPDTAVREALDGLLRLLPGAPEVDPA